MNIPKWLQSSADPAKLSLTLKGIAATVVGVLAVMNIEVPQTEVDNVTGAIVTLAGAVLTLVGVARKVLIWWKSRV